MARSPLLIWALLSAALMPGLTARADWSAESLRWAQRHNGGPVDFHDGNLVTVWSQVGLALSLFGRRPGPLVALHPQGFHNELKVILTPRVRKGKTARRPLLVVLPGLFGRIQDSNALDALRRFKKLGFHLLIIPNSWTPEYVRARPPFTPGAIRAEAVAILDMIREARGLLGAGAVKSISLVGISYGAFQAAAIKAVDLSAQSRLIDGDVTLLSPPIDLAVATQTFDRGFVEEAANLACAGRSQFWEYLRILFAKNERGIPAKTRACANALLYRSFRGLLVEAALALREVSGIGPAPSPQWRKNFTFHEFFTEYTLPAPPPTQTDELKLKTWLTKIADSRATSSLRILSSHDDFVNTDLTWDRELGSLLTPGQLIVLDWGGHYGYVGLKRYDEFIKLSFPVR